MFSVASTCYSPSSPITSASGAGSAFAGADNASAGGALSCLIASDRDLLLSPVAFAGDGSAGRAPSFSIVGGGSLSLLPSSDSRALFLPSTSCTRYFFLPLSPLFILFCSPCLHYLLVTQLFLLKKDYLIQHSKLKGLLSQPDSRKNLFYALGSAHTMRPLR